MKLDDRKITAIGWGPSENIPNHYEWVTVGSETMGRKVTQINCAEQYCGEYSIYWIQVWSNDTLVSRYNARSVDTILYDEDEDENE
jgi:hypothetical protein